MFAALLDTNVLWPSLQRDFLLSLAAEGLYRPLWSHDILAELRLCEMDKLLRCGVSDEQAERRTTWLISEMGRAFDDATVGGYEALIGSFKLPDPQDEHVIAAAVVGNAGVLVTSNLKHFPATLLPPGLDVASPAEFAASTVELDPARGAAAVQALADRSGAVGAPLTADEVLEALSTRYGMGEVRRLVGESMSVTPTTRVGWQAQVTGEKDDEKGAR